MREEDLQNVYNNPYLKGAPVPAYPSDYLTGNANYPNSGVGVCPVPSLFPYKKAFIPFYFLGYTIRNIYNAYYSGRWSL